MSRRRLSMDPVLVLLVPELGQMALSDASLVRFTTTRRRRLSRWSETQQTLSLTARSKTRRSSWRTDSCRRSAGHRGWSVGRIDQTCFTMAHTLMPANTKLLCQFGAYNYYSAADPAFADVGDLSTYVCTTSQKTRPTQKSPRRPFMARRIRESPATSKKSMRVRPSCRVLLQSSVAE